MIDKIAWIRIVDKKILSTLSRNKTVYYLPGGKREPGESDIACLQREIREELSVELLTDSIRYIGVFEAQAHGHAEGIIVKMTCYSADYGGEIVPNNEIDHFTWLAYKDRDRCSVVDQLIFDYLWEQGLIA